MADDLRDLFKNWYPDEFSRPRESPDVPFNRDGNPYETSSETENRTRRTLNEKEVKVMGIWGTQDPQNPDGPPKQTFVLLRDNRGRRAPIFIGPFETLSIQMALEGNTPERPLTHDLIKIMLDRLDSKIDRVTIDDLWQGTFYAKITVAQKMGKDARDNYYDIDARPSDAIALALRARAPIYMAEDVLESAGREMDEDER